MLRFLPGDTLSRHVYVIGGTGVGKSKALESWALELVRRGQGVGVIDPHGDLYDNLVARIAEMSPAVWQRVMLIDPTDPDFTVGFNPLENRASIHPQRQARFLASILVKVFHADEVVTARMQQIMFHTFWLLTLARLTLVQAVPVITDTTWRESLLVSLEPAHPLRQYWEKEYPSTERTATEWAQSTLNKIGPFTSDPDIALMFGQSDSTVDFRQAMDEGKIVLVKLAKGVLGESASHLLGAFLLAQIQLAALSRATQQYSPRKRFTLFLDEFQTYATDDIEQILAESRKYGLALVLAHQFYGQLRQNPELQQAVLNTVENLIAFRIGAQDAEMFVKDIFLPSVDEVKDVRKRRVPTGMDWWPYFTETEVVYRPLQEIWELEARRLTTLRRREFWYKRRGRFQARHLRTPDLPNVRLSPQLATRIDQLRATSADQHGIPKNQAVGELEVHMMEQQEETIPPFDSQ